MHRNEFDSKHLHQNSSCNIQNRNKINPKYSHFINLLQTHRPPLPPLFQLTASRFIHRSHHQIQTKYVNSVLLKNKNPNSFHFSNFKFSIQHHVVFISGDSVAPRDRAPKYKQCGFRIDQKQMSGVIPLFQFQFNIISCFGQHGRTSYKNTSCSAYTK